jgi:hypothetical protein
LLTCSIQITRCFGCWQCVDIKEVPYPCSYLESLITTVEFW